MSILTSRFPLLANNFYGWVVIVLSLVTLLNIGVFQEGVEMPKLISWYIGFAVVLVVMMVHYRGVLQLRTSREILAIVAALVVALGLSAAFSFDLINSIIGIYPRYANSLIFFISWIAGLLVFSAIATKDYIKLLHFYVLLAVAVAIWAIVQTFGIGFYEGPTPSVRVLVPSFLGNPNFSAMFVASCLPLVIYFGLASTRSWARYMYVLSVGLLLVSLVLFSSRGGFAATIAGLSVQALLLLFVKHNRKKSLIAAGLLALFIVVASIFYLNTRTNIAGTEAGNADITTSSRLLVWNYAREYITSNPWTGTGFGNFFLAFRNNTHPALANQEWFDDAHNIVLHLYATTGVPAATLWLLLVAVSVYYAFRVFQKSQSEDERMFAVGLLAAIVAWFVAASFTPVAVPTWILLAMLLAACWHVQSTTITVRSSIVWVVAGVLAIVFALVGVGYLGSELFRLSARDHNEAQRPVPAAVQSKRALLFNPFAGDARMVLISSEIELGNYAEAERHIAVLLRQHPRSAGMYQVAADFYYQLYQKTGDYKYKQQVYAVLGNMITYNTNYAFPYRVAALNMVHFEDYDQALTYAGRSLVLDGGNFNSYILLAKIYYELDNYDGTYRMLSSAFRKVPLQPLKIALQRLRDTQDLRSITFPYNF